MDWANPVEWFAWIYGKYFQGHGIIGGTLIIGFWSLVGLALWLRAIDKYKEDHPKSARTTDTPSVSSEHGGTTPSTQQPHLKSSKTSFQEKPEVQSGKGTNNLNVGSVTSGPCSNVQIGGNNNTATINCASPSRVVTPDKAQQLTADFAKISPQPVWIFPAGTSDDVQPVFRQLCSVLKNASWHPFCQGLNGSIETGAGDPEMSVVDGIQCFSNYSWDIGAGMLVKKALGEAGFECVYINHAFNSPDIEFTGGITILVGTKPSKSSY